MSYSETFPSQGRLFNTVHIAIKSGYVYFYGNNNSHYFYDISLPMFQREDIKQHMLAKTWFTTQMLTFIIEHL